MKSAFVATAFARVFGIGHLPKSPGTFGSLPGLLVGYAFHRLIGDPWGIALALVVLTALSFWCIHVYEKVLGLHDDQRVVLDEVCGQAIAIAFVAPTMVNYAVGFALFRLLAITKPPPIGMIDISATIVLLIIWFLADMVRQLGSGF